jgi:hypothetical protein
MPRGSSLRGRVPSSTDFPGNGGHRPLLSIWKGHQPHAPGFGTLKQRISLLEYLQRRNWTRRRSGSRQEFVGFCPFHAETRPSFYVNTRKNLFYCHGCDRGVDLIRFVELSEHLSFRESLAYLKQHTAAAPEAELLDKTAAFYQLQLHRYPEAAEYLQQRGVRDPALIEGQAARSAHLVVHSQ